MKRCPDKSLYNSTTQDDNSDNLPALIFVSLADLKQDQRNTRTSIMTHRGRTLAQYNVQELRDLFLEMFCATRTAVDNPMMQPSGMAQGRSFLVLEEGEIDGTTGYWTEDEDDGAEGFLESSGRCFLVFDDSEYTWFQRRFQGRQTRRGKGKGKRKGKGKGRGGRRYFKPRRSKGRGKGRRKGRSHMVGEEGYEEDWQEEDWNDFWNEGHWADEQDWNDSLWATEELYCKDEYGYFQKKGKGKKGKKGKDDEGKGKPGDGKGKPNYVQPQTSPHPSIQTQQQQAHYPTAASSSGHGFVSFAETDPARVDVLSASFEEQEYHRRTRRGGQHQRDAVAQQNREAKKRFPVLVGEVDAPRHGLHQRPHPVPREVGLQPDEKSTSFSQLDILIKQRYQISMNALNKQRYHLTRKLDTLAKQRNQLSLNALVRERNHLRKTVSFHFMPSKLMHVRKDYHFTQRILHLQLYAF